MSRIRAAQDLAARTAIVRALGASQGNVRAAALALDVPERTLWHHIRRLGIEVRPYREAKKDFASHSE